MSEITKCPIHTDEEAIGFCHKCGRPVCRFCGLLESEWDRDIYTHIRVRELIKNMGLDLKNYICTECKKRINKISITDIIALFLGIGIFFFGLFIEFIPLSFIGAFILLGSAYSMVKR